MTISYEEEFWSLMFRWRGSLWKAVLRDVITFYAAYYVILIYQVKVIKSQKKPVFFVPRQNFSFTV